MTGLTGDVAEPLHLPTPQLRLDTLASLSSGVAASQGDWMAKGHWGWRERERERAEEGRSESVEDECGRRDRLA